MRAPISILLVSMDTTPADPPKIPAFDFTEENAYKVLRTVDRITIEIDYSGRPTKERLLGVDTPETVHPQKPVKAFGKEASAFTRKLLTSKTVFLRFDQRTGDRYGGLLAYIFRSNDKMFVDQEIVKQGSGHAYTKNPFRYMEVFCHAGKVARGSKKGLWGDAPLVEKKKPPAQGAVYITRTGKNYYREGCELLSESKIPLS